MARKPRTPRSEPAVSKRREVVEKTIRAEGWSEEIVERLVRETGASRRTLYRDKDEIAKLLADEETAGLPERRALYLLDLRRTRGKAVVEGAWAAGARLLEMESKILGLDRVPLPEVEAEKEGELDTSLEGVLLEVRKLRRQAQAGHSYVAADKLLAREHELVMSIRQRDEAIRAAELSHLNEQGLIDLVIANVASLPDALKARLREALEA